MPFERIELSASTLLVVAGQDLSNIIQPSPLKKKEGMYNFEEGKNMELKDRVAEQE